MVGEARAPDHLEERQAQRSTQIEPERLADHIVMLLMDLMSRANQGKGWSIKASIVDPQRKHAQVVAQVKV
jgi:hypothetical protein